MPTALNVHKNISPAPKTVCPLIQLDTYKEAFLLKRQALRHNPFFICKQIMKLQASFTPKVFNEENLN